MIEAPSNITPPVVAGKPSPGSVLWVNPGSWGGWPVFKYNWRREGDVLIGTGICYVPSDSDLGKRITCAVHATNETGMASAESLPVGPVARA
jgi:hypothetical protein